jgi:hypothetical protein
MGDVILLPQRKKTAAARTGEGAAAQIVFFTGVRYQRMNDATPAQVSGPRSEGGKSKRKRG